ncbi:hypothetical protein EDB86DRAFT_2834830 [Lactarius hatsudake]|nr:hypothetical protein EDB86DRAFT_2834830 [Lactarius hatsudake]
MTRLALLPLELVDMILAWARFEPQKATADSRTLVACSRVCKAWNMPAQALLFRDVPISLCHRRRSLLIRSLTQRPDLGRHIRSFGIEISSPPAPWGRDPLQAKVSERFRHMVADFIIILTHAPNLARLTIDIDGELDSVDISKLVSVHLRHLHILNWEGRPSSSALYLLLALWPSIRYLRIDNLYFDPPLEDQRPPSLRSLCARDELSEGFMTWLIPTGDEQPLRELHFESGLLSSRALKDVQAHAPTLHVLTVDKIPSQSLLDALTVLNEFAFRELPTAPVQLPRTVQRVRYHSKGPARLHPRPLDPVAPHTRGTRDEGGDKSMDETGYLTTALKDLPKLALVSATRQAPKGVLTSLEKFCQETNVEFVIYDCSAHYSVGAFLSFDCVALINGPI